MWNLARSLALLLALVPAFPATADDGKAAEQIRLDDELQKLASRNHWAGVERTYAKLVALEIALPPENHLIGAKASLTEGDMTTAWERLRRALPEGSEPTPGPDGSVPVLEGAMAEIWQNIQMIQASYGHVDIAVGEGRIPALVRLEQPFATHERKAIEQAQKRVATERAYKGLLPAGRYMIDGEFFEVATGGALHEVRVAAK